MRTTGIYPVGTLVRLESGLLGVVLEQSATSLLQPLLKVFYDSNDMRYIEPKEVDLAKPLGQGGGDKIICHETPEKWGIKLSEFT